MSQIPRGGKYQRAKIVVATTSDSVIDPQTNATVSQTNTSITEVNPCPGISRPSGLRPPGQMRPPTQLRLPSSTDATSQLRPPSNVCEPCTPGSIPRTPGIAQPIESIGLRAVGSGIQPPGSGLRPRTSGLRPPTVPRSRQTAPMDYQVPSLSRTDLGREFASPPTTRPPSGIRPPSALESPSGIIPHSGIQVPSRIQAPSGIQQAVQKSAVPRLRQTVPMDYQVPSISRTDLRREFGSPTTMRTPSGIQPPSRIQPPSGIQQAAQKPVDQTVRENLEIRALQNPGSKVSAKGKRISKLSAPQTFVTPAGKENLIQRAVYEERVERDPTGERVVKNISVADMNEATGTMDQVELGIQQLDPRFAKADGSEIIGITSTVSITPGYKTISKECLRISTAPADKGVTMAPSYIAQLVEEEKEDVENTLKMVPPDLTVAPGKYGMKQRLQRLRLNSESMALLEQSIIQPELTADEPQAEPNPEVMAKMMHTIEKGVSPQVSPDEVFNTLFQETANEQFVELNSVTPGPLQDVVVPTDLPQDVHQEVLSTDMSKLCEKIANAANVEEVPYVDVFTRVMEDKMKSPQKGKNKPRSFQPITDEKSLWVNSNLEHLVNVCGSEPVDVLDPWNLDELVNSGNMEHELTNGIDFFIECNPLQYVSRVQLRGTQLPSYFPGYMVALPDFPEVVKIARSPDEVFASAWKSVQPKYFAEDSTQSLIF